jgi:NTP pyrophosphatase (non-canonical NTP hydrolase)
VDNHLNTFQQLLTISAEECGELTQVCMKYMKKYTDISQITEESRKKLIEEAGDVLCMINLMKEYNLVSDAELDERIIEKQHKLKKWSSLIK